MNADILTLICVNLNAHEIMALHCVDKNYCGIINSFAAITEIKRRHITVFVVKIGATTEYCHHGRSLIANYTGPFNFTIESKSQKYYTYVNNGQVRYAARCSGCRLNDLAILDSKDFMDLYDYIDEMYHFQCTYEPSIIDTCDRTRRIFIDEFRDSSISTMAQIMESQEMTNLLRAISMAQIIAIV